MSINTEFLTNNIANVVNKDQKQRSFNDITRRTPSFKRNNQLDWPVNLTIIGRFLRILDQVEYTA